MYKFEPYKLRFDFCSIFEHYDKYSYLSINDIKKTA